MLPSALLDHAESLSAQGRVEEAIAAYRQAIEAGSDNAAAPYNLGILLAGKGDLAAARRSFEAACALAPGFREAYFNLGCMAQQQGDADGAIDAFQQALAIDPDYHEARVNLSLALFTRGDIEGAVRAAHLALEAHPDDPDVFANLASYLRALGATEDARLCAEAALRLNPRQTAAWVNLGALASQANDIPAARHCYLQALAAKPDYAQAHWNLALACLAQGDFQQGWEEYEWRLRLPGANRLFPDLGLPLWQGEPLAGKTLLLYAEQGHGDTLQFIRLAQPLAEQGVRVVAQVQPALVRLLARCPWLEEVAAFGAPRPAADYCLPLLSLPQRLGLRLDNIPARVPYLHPIQEEIAAWQEKLAAWPAPRIGLVWAGDPRPSDPESNRTDQRRSLAFGTLRPILNLPGFTFVSLQKGTPAAQLQPQANLIDPTAELTDFAATAALVANLDAVVSVDTAVAHLAGGLGIPTLLLSRYDACWRWQGNQPASPWYPTLELFGQTSPGDWGPAVAAVAARLQATA